MVVSVADLNPGTEVYTKDGEKIGSVNEVMSDPSGSGHHMYIIVHQGGLLGVGGTSLYIPVHEIESHEPSKRVTLGCTKQEADARYQTKPNPGT